MRMAYGYKLKKDDNYVELVEHAVEGLTVTFGVGFLVDIIPIRAPFFVIVFSHRAKSSPVVKYVPEWFPGAGFKRLAKKWRASTRGVVELPWAALKEKYVCILAHVLGLCTKGLLLCQLKGTAPYCNVTSLLDDNGGAQCDAETELIIK